MLNIGRLNKKVTFLSYQEERNEMDQTIQRLHPYKTVWASVEPVSGREYFEAQRIRNELTYKVFIRYLEGIDEDMLIDFKGRIFEIISIINKGEGKKRLDLVCIEKNTKKVGVEDVMWS